MADLIIKGKKFFKVEPTLASIISQLFPDEIQKINKPQFNRGQGHQPPINERKAVWSVGTFGRYGRAALTLELPTGETYPYQFKPEQAQATFTKMGWPVPQQYLDAYAALFAQQPESVWCHPTKQEDIMSRHYNRQRFDCTPPGPPPEGVE